MNIAVSIPDTDLISIEVRVRGRVQGVGFRPFVWRHARELGLNGTIFNDAEGVLIRISGPAPSVSQLLSRIEDQPPSLARVESIELAVYSGELPSSFDIIESSQGKSNTQVAPDACLCVDCEHDTLDPFSRRFRYPFTTCTNCGPRLSIVARVPYDRAHTSMAPFVLCPQCAKEYNDPADRRFHAETTACHVCGPKARLIRFDGKAFSFEQSSMLDDVDAAMGLIQKGEIVAIKGLGGYQLACDATNEAAVMRLRSGKHRDRKPFALMARDIGVVKRYATVVEDEAKLLTSTAAPIVLLPANGPERLPDGIAPGLNTLGFMLPTTPMHALMLKRMPRPVVMTSGNLSSAPQVTSDDDARTQLSPIANYALIHNRDIINRVDDSVVRFAGSKPRVMRRARGYAPAPVRLPRGFEYAPDVLAFGGDLKSAFCLVRSGEAVLSQHIGDLDEAATLIDFERSIALYRDIFDCAPELLAADMHPHYRSSAVAARFSAKHGVPVCEVQHHHAHVASCLAENAWPLTGEPVLGIALDGLGYGLGGEIWGGEFLLADYRRFERLATFKPVAMLGGDQASREPWRNLYTHLMAEIGWAEFAMNFSGLDVFAALSDKPRSVLDAMLRDGLNAPKASSCGRLFDAAAAAIGLCFEVQGYEGEAAARLEAAVDQNALNLEDATLDYPFSIPRLAGSNLPYIEPVSVWNAILGDLILKTPPGVMSARFHRGLARAICTMAVKLAKRDSDDGPRFATVALSGGCFHNRILLEQVEARLRAAGFEVLTHSAVPAGDGGLALGQAAIAAAQILNDKNRKSAGGHAPCA